MQIFLAVISAILHESLRCDFMQTIQIAYCNKRFLYFKVIVISDYYRNCPFLARFIIIIEVFIKNLVITINDCIFSDKREQMCRVAAVKTFDRGMYDFLTLWNLNKSKVIDK